MKHFSFLLLLFLFISGCAEKPVGEPRKVHWDRDMCERCKMVLSDRKFSAQVINPETGRKYMFDDLGCVILWFKEDKIAWSDKAIIWVNDVKSGEWIDARNAFYDTENITPMAYGFGAHLKQESVGGDTEMIDFNELSKRVIKIGK